MKPALLGTLIGTVAGALLWSCSVHRVSDDFMCTSDDQCDPNRTCREGYCVIGERPLVDAPPKPLDAAVCPDICGGTCNFATKSCTIVGTGSGNLSCPAGWNCTIMCGSAGSCGDITCGTSNCTATCTGSAACGDISCTTGDCNVTCSGGSGSAACGTITCTSGDCTATCEGSAACGAVMCTTGSCIETCSGGSAACGTLTCGTGACSATCMGTDPACGNVDCSSACKCDVSCNGTTNACPTVMTCPDRAPGPDYCTVNGSNGQRCSSSFANQCNNC